MFYNPDKKTGFLANKFHNRARCNRDSIADELSFADNNLSDEEKQKSADLFRYCVAKKDTQKIKDKLRETAQHRKALMDFYGEDMKKYCQFYYDMPELVSCDFFDELIEFVSRFYLISV